MYLGLASDTVRHRLITVLCTHTFGKWLGHLMAVLLQLLNTQHRSLHLTFMEPLMSVIYLHLTSHFLTGGQSPPTDLEVCQASSMGGDGTYSIPLV